MKILRGFFVAVGFVGAFGILGTAGASDIDFIGIGQMIKQLLFSAYLIGIAITGFKVLDVLSSRR